MTVEFSDNQIHYWIKNVLRISPSDKQMSLANDLIHLLDRFRITKDKQ